jgi:hypothetical protein
MKKTMLKPNTALQTQLFNRLRESANTERLLPHQQRRLSTSAWASMCDLNLDEDGCNRRMIGLLPLPATRQEHEITETDSLRLNQLLLSIEARRQSCCIRVFSNSRKSRSAILIYRGRLIGCVFGRRGLPRQVFGKQAFEQTMDDLVSPSNIIDAYPLSDEIVLASASIFHGGFNEVFDGAPAVQIYPSCARMMINNRRTGCILLNTHDESAVCITYIFEGQIVGVYSFSEGWLTKTQTAVLNCIETTSDAGILISILPVECEFAKTLTESLTGLDLSGFDPLEEQPKNYLARKTS